MAEHEQPRVVHGVDEDRLWEYGGAGACLAYQLPVPFKTEPIPCVALFYEKSRQRWTLPGGRVDKHEHPMASASRELFEETAGMVIMSEHRRFDTLTISGRRRKSVCVLLEMQQPPLRRDFHKFAEKAREQKKKHCFLEMVDMAHVPISNLIDIVERRSHSVLDVRNRPLRVRDVGRVMITACYESLVQWVRDCPPSVSALAPPLVVFPESSAQREGEQSVKSIGDQVWDDAQSSASSERNSETFVYSYQQQCVFDAETDMHCDSLVEALEAVSMEERAAEQPPGTSADTDTEAGVGVRGEDHNLVSVATFDQLSGWYAERFFALNQYDRYYQALADSLPHTETVSLIDIACGPGNVLSFVARVRPDVSLLGVDLAPGMIAQARMRVPSAQCVVGDCRDLAKVASGRKFHGAAFAFGLSYLTDADVSRFFASLNSVLLPGGTLLLSTITGALEKSEYVSTSSGEQVYMVTRTPQTVREWVQRSGYEIVSEEMVPSPADARLQTDDLVLLARRRIGLTEDGDLSDDSIDL